MYSVPIKRTAGERRSHEAGREEAPGIDNRMSLFLRDVTVEQNGCNGLYDWTESREVSSRFKSRIPASVLASGWSDEGERVWAQRVGDRNEPTRRE
jgi:hypothetical protein